uniref:Uncharacterized protein n=1 Tax=viral metagenome TaxID=1070528 RepID=A0A6C0AY83_9ZZZZ|tara:strand:- start:23613 stop:24005 length:393 start_codon:yes stop_codon:yes gene_type:complete
MSWQMLPNEISIYILKIRNNIRYRASKKIQNAWRKYILPEEIAIDLALQIEIDQYDKIMVSIHSTALKLKYCLSMCSGKHYLLFWKNLAIKLHDSLNVYQYADDDWLTTEAVNYRKIKIQYKKLLNKFNF